MPADKGDGLIVTVGQAPAFTLMLRPREPVQPLASVTVTVNEPVPTELGIPVIAPPLLRLRPAGRPPVVIA